MGRDGVGWPRAKARAKPRDRAKPRAGVGAEG